MDKKNHVYGVKMKMLVSQSCPILLDPMDCSSPGTVTSLSMEFSRQEYWSGLPCPSPGDLCDLGIEPRSPAWQADSLLSEPLGKPTYMEFNSVQSLIATPWTAACLASLSFTNSQSLLKLMSIESVMPSNHLILCRPLLILP